MLTLAGYTIADKLHSSDCSEVYVGVRDSDGLAVVFKVDVRPDSRRSSRAAREYALLRRIDAPGVARALALHRSEGRDVLVLRHFRGLPLSRYRGDREALDTEQFLSIALGVTQSLAAVHEAGIIHKDIKPANILVEPTRLDTCLIDFGISAELGVAKTSLATDLAGTLLYIAPEQTGRVGLGIDFRTDLYSLGASFYELLTGAPPFRSKSPIELIHAHVARVPRRPLERRPDLPEALSRLVMRLLHKDPEFRYQTARGLLADLVECQQQWLRSSAIDPGLVLGRQDRAQRLRFGLGVHGRQHEKAALDAALARTADGRCEFVLVCGAPGIGKSALPGLLRDPVLEAGGYLAQTKFDQERRDAPYAGFAALLRSLLDQILRESGERIDYWRGLLRERLGRLGSVLIELEPELALLLEAGGAPPPGEARERLAVALTRFLSVFARPLQPLVLVLDDLPWADAGTLEVLEALLGASEVGALLVIATARDENGGPSAPMQSLLGRLRERSVPTSVLCLGSLSVEAIRDFLAAVLEREPAETAWLAELVSLKTLANPLLVRRVLEHMCDRELLRYEHGRGWSWDPRQLAELDLSDDAAAMMIAKLAALAPRTRELLISASAIGDAFDPDLLFELGGGDRIALLVELTGLVEKGLLAPCREGFKFVHDRIRESARALIPESERKWLHAHIAELLLARTPASALDERAFTIAEHLNLGPPAHDEATRLRALDLNLRAGRRALRSGAAASAEHYLAIAEQLFAQSDWNARHEIGFELGLLAAESAYQTHDFAGAQARLARLESHARGDYEAAQIDAKRIRVAVLAQGNPLALTLAALRRLGVRWPNRPSWLRVRLAIWRTDWMLRRPLEPELFPRDSPEDPTWLAPLAVIQAGGVQLQNESLRLGLLAASYGLRQYHRHGTPPPRGPALVLAAYAGYRLTLLGSLQRAELYTQAARLWMERRPAASDLRAEFSLQMFLRSWIEPRRSVAEALWSLAESARESGDLESFHYAAAAHVRYLALAGEPISALLHRLGGLCTRGNRRDWAFLESHRRPYELLNADAAEIDWPLELERAHESAAGTAWSTELTLHWVLALSVCGEFERGAALCREAASAIQTRATPGSYRADYLCLRGLCHAALAERTRGFERRGHAGILRACLRELRSWARPGSELVPMTQLLAAEQARLRGARPALAGYASSAAGARERGQRHIAALACERRASLLQRQRRASESADALRQALELYREWGAHAKLAQLERLNPSRPSQG